MVNILIADDNIEINNIYKNFLLKDENIAITQVFDGNDVLNYYFKNKPDILLLDLNLPNKSGIEIINQLSSVPEERKLCNVVVISGEMTFREKLKNTSKIYKIIHKPLRLNELTNIIIEMKLNEEKVVNESNFINLMVKLKFNLYSKGTIYLMDMIKICFSSPHLVANMDKLYELVSIKYNISKIKTKWSVHSSLSTMNKYVSSDLLTSIFNIYDNERNLTPKYFISIVLNLLKQN